MQVIFTHFFLFFECVFKFYNYCVKMLIRDYISKKGRGNPYLCFGMFCIARLFYRFIVSLDTKYHKLCQINYIKEYLLNEIA